LRGDPKTGWEATAFFGPPEYNGGMEIYIKHDDNRSLSRTCYSSMYLKSIRSIKRQFK
jgi:hypothetical protein